MHYANHCSLGKKEQNQVLNAIFITVNILAVC